MAELRLVALALLAAGTARADGTGSGAVAVPAGWRALPRVAAALAEGAKADGVSVEAADAWGEPGRGCFAVSLALRGGDSTADDLLASLSVSPTSSLTATATATPRFTLHDVAHAGDGVTLAFERPPFRGRLRATIAGDAVRALACFGDGREPAACDAACAQVVPK